MHSDHFHLTVVFTIFTGISFAKISKQLLFRFLSHHLMHWIFSRMLMVNSFLQLKPYRLATFLIAFIFHSRAIHIKPCTSWIMESCSDKNRNHACFACLAWCIASTMAYELYLKMTQNCFDRDSPRDLICIQTSKWPKLQNGSNFKMAQTSKCSIWRWRKLEIVHSGSLQNKIQFVRWKFRSFGPFWSLWPFWRSNFKMAQNWRIIIWAILKFECISSHVVLSLSQQF